MQTPQYIKWHELIEEHLLELLPEIDQKSVTLYDSMSYSLMAGGKRLRPILLLAACEFSGGDENSAIPYACALECIHTYSLIHDDLPSMDNDTLRRGRPTNHMVFGESMAILAGDGLLSSAFEIMFKDMLLYFDKPEKLNQRIRAAYAIAKGAGCQGMIAGQVADIENEGKICSKEMLDYIHLNKTAALIVSAVHAGAFLGSADNKMLSDLSCYAECMGLAFQVSDDILDIEGSAEEMGKNTGQDSSKSKSTFLSIYGMKEAKQCLKTLTQKAIDIMEPYYDEAEFFINLAKELEVRTK
ncbi:MAG: polyprenyl synthetase family protein [Anaerovoracaceae bacterium]